MRDAPRCSLLRHRCCLVWTNKHRSKLGQPSSPDPFDFSRTPFPILPQSRSRIVDRVPTRVMLARLARPTRSRSRCFSSRPAVSPTSGATLQIETGVDGVRRSSRCLTRRTDGRTDGQTDPLSLSVSPDSMSVALTRWCEKRLFIAKALVSQHRTCDLARLGIWFDCLDSERAGLEFAFWDSLF